MTKHAILSPSGSKRWMQCAGSALMEVGHKDKGSSFAEEGTAAHEVAETCLRLGRNAVEYIGTMIPMESGNQVEVTDEMAEYVQIYIDLVRHYAVGGDLLVEQAIPIGIITGETGAEGTADAVVILGNELYVIDLKYGKGNEVSAVSNEQLMIYAIGALHKYEMLADFKRVHLVIIQPRINANPSEWDCSIELLDEFAEQVSTRAKRALEILKVGMVHESDLSPSESACQWCKAKGSCHALAAHVSRTIGAEFTDLTTHDKVEQDLIVDRLVATDNLGAKMDAVELIESWCKAIRARVEGELLSGKPVAGYKLVQGRRGARAWTDKDQVESAFKSMRLNQDEMYDFTLISPTTAEKLLKDQPKRWAKVSALIKQSEGKPSVAPVTDKRPALDISAVNDFEHISEGSEFV